MNLHSPFRLPWHTFWVLKKKHTEPLWAQMIVGAALALPIGFGMMLINGMITDRVSDLGWWRASLPFNLFICLSVAYCILAFMRGVEKLVPEDSIASISAAGDARAGLVINAIVIAGIVCGVALSLTVFGWLADRDVWVMVRTSRNAKTELLAFLIVIVAANWFWWRLRVKQDRLVQQASMAQLRLLQAQIEPHFLFNTLANVQSMIKRDTPRAEQMLEAFTDYLRASLGQLRHPDGNLAAELEMARCYLTLMQIRMEERLSFDIDASEDALAATLPTLLLQPLVENAIRHGLEPKIEGGRVRISARVTGGRLDIRVDDDGMGTDGPPRLGQQGNGMALANIRERLRARYGGNAALILAPQDPGMRATLSVPLATRRTSMPATRTPWWRRWMGNT